MYPWPFTLTTICRGTMQATAAQLHEALRQAGHPTSVEQCRVYFGINSSGAGYSPEHSCLLLSPSNIYSLTNCKSQGNRWVVPSSCSVSPISHIREMEGASILPSLTCAHSKIRYISVARNRLKFKHSLFKCNRLQPFLRALSPLSH